MSTTSTIPAEIAGLERRYLPSGAAALELRAITDADSPGTIVGHSPVWNQKSEDLGGYREVIRPGACSKSVREGDVRALVDHDTAKVIGRRRPGAVGSTLTLAPDEVGLRFEIRLPDTQTGRDLAESVRRGDITGSSFGFTTTRADVDWQNDENGQPLRIVRSMNLVEVSIVTFPAYPDANDVNVRTAMQSLDLDGWTADQLTVAAQRGTLADILADPSTSTPPTLDDLDLGSRDVHLARRQLDLMNLDR